MFDVKKENCNTVVEKLLWNIQECLKKDAPLVLPQEVKEEVKEEVVVKEEKPKVLNCKFCGGNHTTNGQFLACARKHKNMKGGGKNV